MLSNRPTSAAEGVDVRLCNARRRIGAKRSIGQRGMTLLEVLAVLVIIGILAYIAIVRTRTMKDKSLLAAVRMAIHNLVVAEEAYFFDFKTYGSLNQLQSSKVLRLSAGNTMTISTSAAGFTATATNSAITSSIKSCTIRVGSGGSAVDGKLTCP